MRELNTIRGLFLLDKLPIKVAHELNAVATTRRLATHHQYDAEPPFRDLRITHRAGCAYPHTKRLPVAGLGIPRRRYSLKASYTAPFPARLVALHPDRLVTTRAVPRARSGTLRSSELLIALSTDTILCYRLIIILVGAR